MTERISNKRKWANDYTKFNLNDKVLKYKNIIKGFVEKIYRHNKKSKKKALNENIDYTIYKITRLRQHNLVDLISNDETKKLSVLLKPLI